MPFRVLLTAMPILVQVAWAGDVSISDAHSTTTPCGRNAKTSQGQATDLSWVDSDQLIYGVDDEGLYEAHLNSPKHVLLQPVEEKYLRRISISPDQTRVLYAAAKDEYGHDTHYYLYDIQKKKSVAIPGLRAHPPVPM